MSSAPGGVHIREALEGDAPVAVLVLRASAGHPARESLRLSAADTAIWCEGYRVDRLAPRLALRAGDCFVAELDGQVVGFGHVALETARIVQCYVLPERQGRGAGARLMEAMEDALRARSAIRVTLHSTTPAVGFYEARGYQVVGEPKRFWGILDGVPMAKPLREDVE